jgi:hypothetical protein
MKRFLGRTVVLTCALAAGSLPVIAQSWKFGVMADTQWGMPDDGKNPNSCAVDIVKALNKQFIDKKVKFVIEVGDLVDKIGDKQTGTTAETIANAEDVRAVFAQELYNAGVGFFPVRGNHDSHRLSGAEFKRIYPQTQTGTMNATPANAFSVPNPDAATQPFPRPEGAPFTLGSNFETPLPAETKDLDWRGLTYSFDYNNVRFVLVDQFAPLNAKEGEKPDLTLVEQVPWINRTLAAKPSNGHVFVFGHKGLISENHVDTLFGSDPTQSASSQDAFISAMFKNGVRYYIQGHDHMHNRALVSVTSGTPRPNRWRDNCPQSRAGPRDVSGPSHSGDPNTRCGESRRSGMKIASIVSSYLLGLLFTIFGLNGWRRHGGRFPAFQTTLNLGRQCSAFSYSGLPVHHRPVRH